jgi:micrococcal nuclease
MTFSQPPERLPLTIRAGGNDQKLRLCGIDAPEIAHGGRPGQPLGDAAAAKLKLLVSGAGGQVIVTPIEQDRYGRMVAEVFVKQPHGPEEVFVNGEMVRAGMAHHYGKYSGRCMNRIAIERAEEIAREKKVGVWSLTNSVKPWDWRRAKRQG